MGKRLTQAFKLLEKDYRLKVKKERWDKGIPTFKTFDIPFELRKSLEDITLYVTDVLNVESPTRESRVIKVDKKGSTYMITSIVCPVCNQILVINKHWHCYFCEDISHGRKIFEITKVEYPVEDTGEDTSEASQEESTD